MNPNTSEKLPLFPTRAPSLLRMLMLAMALPVLTGCRTWNYTEADLEREARLMSGHGSEPCPNGCWHVAHGFQPGYPIRSGGRHGP